MDTQAGHHTAYMLLTCDFHSFIFISRESKSDDDEDVDSLI